MDQFGRGSTNINDFLTQQQQGQSQPPPSSQQQQQQWSASDFSSYLQQQQQQQGGGFNSNSLGAIYVSNIPPPSSLMPQQSSQTQQPPPQQQFDQNGQPIKIRKKPGRKPNPASPALRKAQNRAAQRAFRERKERHLKDLEGTIRQLREQRNSAVKELNQTKSKMDAFRAENWYLKGVVLTLQFVCLHHSIHIPTHSPYLTEEALSEMAKTTPHAIEAYVNAYTRNNINLKPTMAAHFANSTPTTEEDKVPLEENILKEEKSRRTEENMDMDEEEGGRDEYDEELEGGEEGDDGYSQATGGRRSSQYKNSLSPASPGYIKIEEDEMDESMTQWLKQHDENKKKQAQVQKEAAAAEKEATEKQQSNASSSLSAIQRIRLQLRVQSTVTGISNKSKLRLQPTILQLAIPHDPRIDLIPTPHMRDRMIIFRDQMDYDKCFAMLLNGAMYHGGDPTMSASWELPAEFFTEFWYLAINYDVNRTNTWRRLKGLPEIRGGPLLTKEQEQEQEQQQVYQQQQEWQQQQQQEASGSSPYTVESSSIAAGPNSDTGTVWTDDVFAQMTAGMPTLQPLDSNHLTSGFDFGSPPSTVMYDDHLYHPYQSNHPLFDQFMAASASSPEATGGNRHHDRSPSIGTMMDLMNTLSTDMSQQH